ncbi:MAG: PQQ-binding-like beta-propeller repeat protein [Phycisphaerales bacterium]
MQRALTRITPFVAGLCLTASAGLAQKANTKTDTPEIEKQRLIAADTQRITPGHVVMDHVVEGELIRMTGTPRPRFEPADSHGHAIRQGEAERLALRKSLDWMNLNEDQRKALAPIAVGPDQLDEELMGPINLVNFAWSYSPNLRGSDRVANGIALNVEGDVVIAGTRFADPDSAEPPELARILISEIVGTNTAGQGWVENWEREPQHGGPQSEAYVTAEAVTSDLFGNTFTCGARITGQYSVWHFDGDTGMTMSNRSFDIPDGLGTDAVATDIAIDPEGIVYVCGHYKSTAGGGNNRWFIAQHTPYSNLDQLWITTFDNAGRGTPSGGIEIDRLGNVYVAGDAANNFKCVRVNPYDGGLDWEFEDNTAQNDTVAAMQLDFDGNPHLCGNEDNESNWKIVKLDRETGQEVWRNTASNGESTDIAIDPLTNLVYAVGNSNNNTFRVEQYNPNTGNRNWRVSYGTTGQATKVTIDRLGNPYVAGWFGDFDQDIEVRKFNPEDGAEVWQVQDHPGGLLQNNKTIVPTGLVVDGGGSVYVSGWRDAENPNSGAEGKEFFLTKWTQPYVSIPQIATDTTNMRLEGRSIWDPTASSQVLQGFDEEFRLVRFDITDILPNLSSSLTRTLDLSIFGSVTGGVDFDLRQAEMDITFETAATGGSFDTTITGPVAIAVPAESELVSGQPFDITVGWAGDEGGMEFIANAEPDLAAELIAKLRAQVDFELFAENGSGDQVFPSVQILSNNQSNIDVPDLKIFGFDLFPLPPAGTWYDFEAAPDPFDDFVVGKVRSPELTVEGDYDPEQALFASSISEKILDARINITNIISWYTTGIPTFASFGSPAGNDSYDAEITASLIQAYLRGDIFLEQDLTLDFTPYVRLSFDDPSVNDVTLDLALNGSPGDPAYPSFQSTYQYPAFPASGELEITPTFGIKATLQNRSGMEFGAYAGFESISLEASLAAVDTDIISVDKCFGCIEQDLLANNLIGGVSSHLNGGEFTLLNLTSSEFEFPNEQTLASMQIFGDTDDRPQLIGASREAASMIIYDQRNPSQSQINTAAGGTEPMILYGRKFFSSGTNTAFIRHHGRTEALDTTRLNNQALLVHVPQRFFLLPGVARIWVNNSDTGKSETIEFEVRYPTPNFQGLEETPWAADNRFRQMPLTAVDGGTPRGNDSFIARRDYYRNMGMNLWNTGLTGTEPFVPAFLFFPEFDGWETIMQGPQPPGFPTLIWEGTPLPRFRPDPNDGLFRSRLPLQYFTEPGFYDVQLCNPGPGGGPSRVRTLELAAPVPVIQRLNISSVRPGVNEGLIELRVFGPRSVPFFEGYEEAKYGNFTKNSVVKIDGVTYPTKFNGPGFLSAEIPATIFDVPGLRNVTVESPSNGTEYYELLLNGDGSTAFDGMVPSGGESLARTIEVAWPAPTVTFVSHPIIEENEPPLVPDLIDGVPPEDNLNITVKGRNFAPGCTVYLDGIAIPSDRVTPTIVRARITASDVASIGLRRITVENPSPNRRESNEYPIMVVPDVP